LGRLFKEETGQSPLQYLHDLRLAHACQLLVREFKNVQKIAEEVGFRQVGYFNRVFKACYGCTPSAYRRQSAGKKIAKKIA
jgi:AraC-like DNA-binding protein